MTGNVRARLSKRLFDPAKCPDPQAEQDQGTGQERELGADDEPPAGHPVGQRPAPRAQEKGRADLDGGEKGRPLGLVRLFVGQPDEGGDLRPRPDQ